MAEWLDSISTHWFWLSLGLILGVAEMVAPGFFLMWLGLAAIIVGVLDYFLPITVAYQVAMFAILSVLTVFAGKKFLQQNPIETTDPKLNDRGARLTGEVVNMTSAALPATSAATEPSDFTPEPVNMTGRSFLA